MSASKPAQTKPRVIVFAKPPIAGKVKTRIGKRLGADTAARVYRHLLWQTLQRLNNPAWQLQLMAAHPLRHPFLRRCARHFNLTLVAQAPGSLGRRMARAFGDTRWGREKTLLVGSDCPGLDAHYCRRALQALDQCYAVFVPASDGGYVLVGLRKSEYRLFGGMRWSTSRVMTQTRARCRRLAWETRELETLQDVDEAAAVRKIGRWWRAPR